MELQALSDQELYNLIQDKNLEPEALEMARQEFLARNLSIEVVDILGMNREADSIKLNNKDLSFSDKFSIIVFPFVPPLQAVFANKHLAKNNLKSWKQHWNYVALGFTFWTIVIILFARLFLF
ncbi:hypothetical protein G7074_13170 [Pedobacter sp. HDW13]|uniref:hypothetical protein n=1 Tax=unclassified Pedobacter TaxID=2628915 RepID=UPI000F5AD817|nr:MULTISPECIES: hypothetical protein [unclassified Pedobacter]QIL40129.1 hypothetical protein G7074_13170 [Pedobacter sp. HDW13]RQO68372.1 hypothetical protein DBR40_20735 [Pedobacter sp. KBW01]